MSQSDIGDGLHLAVPNLYTQMSQERQRGAGKEGGREADRGRGERERESAGAAFSDSW